MVVVAVAAVVVVTEAGTVAVVSVADEVHGFRFFDERDLLGFVDGTENPVGRAAGTAAPGMASGLVRAAVQGQDQAGPR